jgi:hypothetical protein
LAVGSIAWLAVMHHPFSNLLRLLDGDAFEQVLGQ